MISTWNPIFSIILFFFISSHDIAKICTSIIVDILGIITHVTRLELQSAVEILNENKKANV